MGNEKEIQKYTTLLRTNWSSIATISEKLRQMRGEY